MLGWEYDTKEELCACVCVCVCVCVKPHKRMALKNKKTGNLLKSNNEGLSLDQFCREKKKYYVFWACL